MLVGGHVSVVSPTLRWEDAPRRLRLPAPQVFDHRLPVEGVGNRLPYPRIFQDRIAQIESEIREPGSDRVFDSKMGIARQCIDRVGRE
jgi:hypothetical protein